MHPQIWTNILPEIEYYVIPWFCEHSSLDSSDRFCIIRKRDHTERPVSHFPNSIQSIRHKANKRAKWGKYARMNFLRPLRTVVFEFNSFQSHWKDANCTKFSAGALVVMYAIHTYKANAAFFKNWYTHPNLQKGLHKKFSKNIVSEQPFYFCKHTEKSPCFQHFIYSTKSAIQKNRKKWSQKLAKQRNAQKRLQTLRYVFHLL